MRYVYNATITPDPAGGLLVTFADVPEAITSGEDRADALVNGAEALGMALRSYLAEGQAIPSPHAPRIAIAVPADDAMKIALIEAFRESGCCVSFTVSRR